MNTTLTLGICGILFSAGLVGCKSNSQTSAPATTEVSPETLVAPTTAPAEPTVLKFGHESLTRILAGNQTSTTRKGIRNYPNGPAILQSGDQQVQIVITGMKHSKFSELTVDEAKSDGFTTLEELQDSLKQSYPDIVDSDDVTTVYIQVPTGK